MLKMQVLNDEGGYTRDVYTQDAFIWVTGLGELITRDVKYVYV